MKKIATVVIPCYNYPDKVGRAIRSALAQSINNIEVIVIDDGSDNSDAIKNAVEKATRITRDGIEYLDRRVKLVRQDNRGVAIARNVGISHGSAPFIVCLDADDAIGPEFLAKNIDVLESDRSLGISYSSLVYAKPDGETFLVGISNWPDAFDYQAQLEKRNQIPTACVFRRSLWERSGGYRARYAPKGAGSEDAEFWLRAGSLGFGAKYSDEDLMRTINIEYSQYCLDTGEKSSAEGKYRFCSERHPELLASAFYYSWQTGRVSGDREYQEVDWTTWHPWTKDDNLHPFASIAKPLQGRASHAVRQYDQPIISVVIPVGPGHESEVINALDSLEAQTFLRWEAILVADGCTPLMPGIDDPQSFLDAYPFVRIFYIGDEPRGAGYARNLGASHARAPFLFFLDADDWLTPTALESHLSTWNENEAIIYADYYGKAEIDDPSKLAPQLQKDFLATLPTGESVLRYRSAQYDCQRAQQQPDSDDPSKLYHWCLVSCLIPRAWHDDIGGFDEKLPTWEDVDYHWRMARAGYCYFHLEEPLTVYRFYTGTRRDKSHKISKSLLEYIRKKYSSEEIMPCRSCGGNRSKTPAPTVMTSRSTPRVSGAQKVVNMSEDTNYVMVQLNDGNHGGHPIIGGATHTKYGYRSHGQRFLIHRDDFSVAPHNYILVEDREKQAAVTAPQATKPVSTPAPEPIKEPERPKELRDYEIDDSGALVESEEELSVAFDPQLIQGVTPAIAEAMVARGITSYDQLAALSDEEIRSIEGVGPSRFRAIKQWRADYLRPKEMEPEEILDDESEEESEEPPDEDDSNTSFSGFLGA